MINDDLVKQIWAAHIEQSTPGEAGTELLDTLRIIHDLYEDWFADNAPVAEEALSNLINCVDFSTDYLLAKEDEE